MIGEGYVCICVCESVNVCVYVCMYESRMFQFNSLVSISDIDSQEDKRRVCMYVCVCMYVSERFQFNDYFGYRLTRG
jgi:hypothetical protein